MFTAMLDLMHQHRTTSLSVHDSLIVPVSKADLASKTLKAKHRGGLVRLPSAQKNYSGLTINVWNRSGGKHAFVSDGPIIAEGVARTIQTRPAEHWLVVHHKPTGEMNFEKLGSSEGVAR